MRYEVSSKEHDGSSLLLKAPYIHTYLIQRKLFILIVQYAGVINIVVIIGIFSLIELKHVFSTPVAPGRHPIPRDRATAPSPTHTAALAIPDARTGIAAKVGERRLFKVALPETASNQYLVHFLLAQRCSARFCTERQLNLPVSALSIFFSVVVLLYCCCTHMVGS